MSSDIDKTRRCKFQLTRSRGAWRHAVIRGGHVCNFNSHAHVERDSRRCLLFLQWRYFNSHAHVERDAKEYLQNAHKIISTHTLTWSVTTEINTSNTHIWFQLTRSRGAWRSRWKHSERIREFQLTRSRGAWRSCLLGTSGEDDFNSHAHVERDYNQHKPLCQCH